MTEATTPLEAFEKLDRLTGAALRGENQGIRYWVNQDEYDLMLNAASGGPPIQLGSFSFSFSKSFSGGFSV
jgi:hypothetical protein